MSNRTTFALFVGFVVAVAFLLGGYWRASTDRIVLREQVRDQAKIAATAQMKLSEAADQLKKQLEEVNGQIETLEHEKGELKLSLQDQTQMKKETEALNQQLNALKEMNEKMKKDTDAANQDKKNLNDEVLTLRSKVTDLSKTLNDTVVKQEAQAKQLQQKEKELQEKAAAAAAAKPAEAAVPAKPAESKEKAAEKAPEKKE
ncbi:uncharacterized protein [Amphiura filiformis]|uniref:uncharacterized protein n=1 Tax=Amphiura filiformis TaxID=82378 RepID=UPI003B21558B